MGILFSEPEFTVNALDVKTITDVCSKEMLSVNNFLDEIPLRSNYQISLTEGKYMLSEIYHISVKDSSPFKTHLSAEGLNNKCLLVVNKRQYDMICFFRDYNATY